MYILKPRASKEVKNVLSRVKILFVNYVIFLQLPLLLCQKNMT